jgi:ABC-2 type transport system permease protein
MTAIFKKELRTYFTTLTGYAFLGFFVLITGYFFVSLNIVGGSTNYSETLLGTMIMFLLLVPVLTMRLFADEAKQKTDQLLYTTPIKVTDIVLGKFFAAGFLFLLGIAITMIFPFILSRLGEIDVKETVGVVLGYFLMGMCLISVGVFISVLTDNQIVAAAATFVAEIFFLVMIDTIVTTAPLGRVPSLIFIAAILLVVLIVLHTSTKNVLVTTVAAVLGFGVLAALYFTMPSLFDSTISRVLSWLSVLDRFQNFYLGVFGLSDVVYYVTFSAAFVYLTVSVIEKRRWS